MCHVSYFGSIMISLFGRSLCVKLVKSLCIRVVMCLTLIASWLYSLRDLSFTWMERLIQSAYIIFPFHLTPIVFAYLLMSMYPPRVLLWQPHASLWKLSSEVHDLTLFEVTFSWHHIDQHVSPSGSLMFLLLAEALDIFCLCHSFFPSDALYCLDSLTSQIKELYLLSMFLGVILFTVRSLPCVYH